MPPRRKFNDLKQQANEYMTGRERAQEWNRAEQYVQQKPINRFSSPRRRMLLGVCEAELSLWIATTGNTASSARLASPGRSRMPSVTAHPSW